MSEHSIEVLGQKFSYPTTWQGAFSVLVVSVSISFLAFRLSPEQISSFSSLFGHESAVKFENGLVLLNKKLSSEVSVLKSEILRLTQEENIPQQNREAILSKIKASDKRLNDVYAEAIKKQKERKNKISEVIPKANAQEQRLLTLEKTRISNQIGLLEQQQRNQQVH